eukprot:9475650-Karenia_brevis.AAC.1
MFREDVSLGHMRHEAESVAKAEYGQHLVMAASGALQKADNTFRIIHDGTHGVHVNPRIKPRDQGRYPGIPEKRKILSRAARLSWSHF